MGPRPKRPIARGVGLFFGPKWTTRGGYKLATLPTDWQPAKEFLEQHRHLFSKNTFYKELRKGTLPHIRVGKKIFLHKDALTHMAKAQGDGKK